MQSTLGNYAGHSSLRWGTCMLYNGWGIPATLIPTNVCWTCSGNNAPFLSAALAVPMMKALIKRRSVQGTASSTAHRTQVYHLSSFVCPTSRGERVDDDVSLVHGVERDNELIELQRAKLSSSVKYKKGFFIHFPFQRNRSRNDDGWTEFKDYWRGETHALVCVEDLF